MLVDLRSFDPDLTGKVAQEALDKSGITLNRNQIPGRPEIPVHNERPAHRYGGRDHDRHAGARDGRDSPAHRRVLAAPDDEDERKAVREEVATLCSKFVPYP